MREGETVIAFDPGGTTGGALYTPSTDYFDSFQIEGGREGFWEYARRYEIVRGGPVVCEDYIINAGTASKSQQTDPLRIAGYLEGTCYASGTAFILQTPAQAKRFASDDKLKHLGWWNPTTGGHANDAARHLLTYMIGQEQGTPLLLRLSEML